MEQKLFLQKLSLQLTKLITSDESGKEMSSCITFLVSIEPFYCDKCLFEKMEKEYFCFPYTLEVLDVTASGICVRIDFDNDPSYLWEIRNDIEQQIMNALTSIAFSVDRPKLDDLKNLDIHTELHFDIAKFNLRMLTLRTSDVHVDMFRNCLRRVRFAHSMHFFQNLSS